MYKVNAKILKTRLDNADEFVETLMENAPDDDDIYVYAVSDDNTHVYVTFDVYAISESNAAITAQYYCTDVLELDDDDFMVEYVEKDDDEED